MGFATDAEVPPSIPPDWRWVTVGDTAEYLNGFAFKPTDWHSDGMPIIRIQNLTDPTKEPNRTTTIVPERYRVRDGDLLVSWSATLDAFIWRGEDAWLNQHIFKVLPRSGTFDSRFLHYGLQWAIRQMTKTDHLHGSTMRHINRGPFLAHPFPKPPLAQQRAIGLRVEELFGEIEAGEQELAAAKADLARYRRAVLKAAVTGELTRDWRATRKPTETGADLLARILKARRDRRVSTRESARPDTSQLPELPRGWVWSSLGHLTVDGPTNGYSPKASAGASGTWSLKLTATTSGRFRSDSAALKRLDEVVEPGSKYWLQPNDLLLQRGNTIEYVGIAAIYEGPPNTFVYPDLMIRVRLIDNSLLHWVWRCINAPYARSWIAERATGTAGTMPKINGEVVRAMPIPIPPILEAQQIAERVDQSMAVCDEVSAAIEAAKVDSSLARASILAAAFSGRLVSDNDNLRKSRAA